MLKKERNRMLKKKKLKYIIMAPVIIVLLWFLWYIYSNVSYWMMDKDEISYSVVTLNGIESPRLNFYNASNKNIGHMNLDAKGSLYEFNKELIEDKEHFYFVGDTTGYAEKQYILKVDKKDYTQKKIYIDKNPSYFTIDKDKLYITDSILNNFDIDEVDINTKKIKVHHVKAGIRGDSDNLEPYLYVNDDIFYYFKEDKKSVSMFTYDNKEKEEKEILKIKEFNNMQDAKYINNKIYMLCAYNDHNEVYINKMTKSYALVIYDKERRSYKKVDIPISKGDSKYFYGHLFVYGDKLILLETVTSPLFKQGNKVRYYDIKKEKLMEIDVEEIPNNCRVIDRKLYFLSQDRLDIYDKELNHIKKVKLSGAFGKNKKDDYTDIVILSK